ncbi:hypothetical protein [Sphingobium sp. B8D3D]|nr:hypothetical protein [Sphingobium sp. B8D3D]
MPLTDEALAEIERRLAGPRAESPQADPYFLSNQAFIGSALSWQAQEPSWHFSFDSVTFDGLFKAFDDQEGSPAPFSQTPYAGWDDDTLQRSPTNKVRVFSDSVEMPAVPSGALVAVTVRSEGGATRVTAIQPSFLAPPEGLSLPVLPRYASETSRQMQIHLIGDDEVKASQEFHFNVPPSHIEPWMLSAYLNRGGGGNPVIRAFAAGTGCRLAYAEDEPETLSDIPVVWGVLRDSDRILAQAQAQGLHFFYIDHAYFDRGHGKSYRITRNRFEAGKVRKVGADRLQRLDLDIQPWRKSGKAIIVCPPTDYFMAAHGCADWLETTLAKLHLETDRPIIVREKPQPGQPTVPLAKALRHAHALVTHSSNVAIEAACLGTPVFVSPTSAAAPIGQTDVGLIESPVYPDRDEWLCHLAYSQYAMEEIRDGTAWHILKHLEACDFV